MANPKLPPGAVSKRHLTTHFGFNTKHILTLLRLGVLRTLGLGVDVTSLAGLREGIHYVVCRACFAKQAAVTTKHLRACSGLGLGQYRVQYPDAPLATTLTSIKRAKSDDQRARQAHVLRQRFQTPEGLVTREKIRVASVRLMQTPYRSRASAHLTEYNQTHRQERSAEWRARWQDPVFRARMQAVHLRRRAALEASVARARGYRTTTFTRPHQVLERALVDAGVQGLVREYLVGYYRVDEALPELKLAVEMDGCYWHGCLQCGFPGRPATRVTDKRKTTYLLKQGWRVLRVPEHRVRDDLARVVEEILEASHG